jgi:hypothetical protein
MNWSDPKGFTAQAQKILHMPQQVIVMSLGTVDGKPCRLIEDYTLFILIEKLFGLKT